MKKGLSISIPTWEMHGKGASFLKFSFDILNKQTFKDFEVVVTDDSKDEYVKRVCEEYSDEFELHYYKNPHPPAKPVHPSIITIPKGSVNSNYNISKCSREIIKFLWQDDFLSSETSLEKTYNTFIETESKWLVTGCEHTSDGRDRYRPMVPAYNDQISKGVNTISSPSVLSVINEDVLLYDERLIVTMDCDYYRRLYMKYGLPTVLEDITVVNRIHDGQIAKTHAQGERYVLNKEIAYIQRKFRDEPYPV